MFPQTGPGGHHALSTGLHTLTGKTRSLFSRTEQGGGREQAESCTECGNCCSGISCRRLTSKGRRSGFCLGAEGKLPRKGVSGMVPDGKRSISRGAGAESSLCKSEGHWHDRAWWDTAQLSSQNTDRKKEGVQEWSGEGVGSIQSRKDLEGHKRVLALTINQLF